MSEIDSFQQEVLQAYKDKKQQNALPPGLIEPTVARLKKALKSFDTPNLSRDDERTLREVFDSRRTQRDLVLLIEQAPDTIFRTLQNYMTSDSQRPTSEYVGDLLAILIDFQPRPFVKWRQEKKIKPPTAGGGSRGEDKPLHHLPPHQSNTTTGVKNKILLGGLALSVIAGTYHLSDRSDHQCMYWQTDRYVSVDCRQQLTGVTLVPLDKEAIRNFRRITRPDTLTLRSVGKVWYWKPAADSAEFFTAAGTYPGRPDKHLKPATKYMIEKYVLNKKR